MIAALGLWAAYSVGMPALGLGLVVSGAAVHDAWKRRS